MVENPHFTVQINFQQRFAMNVWCGLISNKLIGPYFLDGHLTVSITYLQFLQDILPQIIE